MPFDEAAVWVCCWLTGALVVRESAKPGARCARRASIVEDGRDQPVGGATSSRPLCRASGPSWVTPTAAITSRMAMQANTALRP